MHDLSTVMEYILIEEGKSEKQTIWLTRESAAFFRFTIPCSQQERAVSLFCFFFMRSTCHYLKESKQRVPLLGSAHLDPVSSERLGECAFEPLFSQSGCTCLLLKKNGSKLLLLSYAYQSGHIFSLFLKNKKRMLQLLPIVYEGLF